MSNIEQESTAGLYCVTFVGQYFNLTTIVLDAENEEQAIRMADDNIALEYGWNVAEVSDEITAVLEGGYGV